MIAADERPCKMRPSIRKVSARGPLGAKPTRSEPAMLKRNPQFNTRTRPRRSARPPMTTMKMPENRAVMKTAIFMMLVSTPKSSAMTGAMLRVV